MTQSEPETRRRTRRWLTWVGAVVIFALGIVIVVAVTQSGADRSTGSASPTPKPSATPGASASDVPSPGTPTSVPSAASSPTATAAPSEEPPVEPPAPRETLPPVPLDESNEPAPGLEIALSKIEAVDGEASVPGEIAGPALQITISATNSADAEAPTATAIMNVYYGPERLPANILVSPREDLPQFVPPGETVTGVYAFSVPVDQRDQILIELDLALDLPVVLFEGAVGP